MGLGHAIVVVVNVVFDEPEFEDDGNCDEDEAVELRV